MLLSNLNEAGIMGGSMRAAFFYRYNFLLLFFFMVVALSGCSSIKPSTDTSAGHQLSAVTDDPTHQYYPGKFIWHDLLTPERDKAKQFYGQLLGWTFKDDGNYSIIFNQDKKIGGIIEVKHSAEQNAEAIWLASMSIDNMDKAISVVQSHGGQILKGPLNMDNRGQGVLMSDPLGAHLILLKAADGDPVDDEVKIGDWLWNEIWTHQPDKTLPFYTALAPYTSIPHSDGYHILKSQEKWRAGVRQTFAEKGKNKDLDKNTKVRWVPTIRVDDPNTLLNKVEALGGRIVLHPGEHPSDDNTALIVDNTGALLMIQSWDSQVDEGAQSL